MKNETKRSEEKLLLNKIAGYSVLAGVSLLLAPTTAKGAIVYKDPADITINNLSSFYDLDLNNDTVIDFRFSHFKTSSLYTKTTFTYSNITMTTPGGGTATSMIYETSYTFYNYLTSYLRMGPKGSNLAKKTGGYIDRLLPNVSLNNALNWGTGNLAMASLISTKTSRLTNDGSRYVINSATAKNGPWASDAINKFIGVKFKIGESWHFGWIRASVTLEAGNSKIVIHDWAYEDTPDTPIKTGEVDIPLPIELSSFGAIEQAGNVLINWQTASETENIGFVLQRKSGNGLWEDLADYRNDLGLEGQGTSSKAHNYSYLDNSVLPGTSYSYRLGDIDHANKITWHKEVEITLSEGREKMPGEFGLQAAFPNPFNPTLTIRYGLTEDAQTKVNILDLQGKTIASLENKFQKAGSHELQWQATDAASGIYMVEIIAGGKRDLKKVLLTK
ncbi:MAG: T9SS type A sorting domain-containing protein [Candidatus Neomarinimicrobiota bacterium]